MAQAEARTRVGKNNSSICPAHPTGQILLRKCACGQHAVGGSCDECKKKHETLQRHSVRSSPSPEEVPSIVHEVLRSPGQSLDKSTRDFMGTRFHYDFSNVRVHTDPKASESARSVNAAAYTVGPHVVFDQPPSVTNAQDRGLIVHELAHVMQQRDASPAGSLKIDTSGEAEAESAERTIGVRSLPAANATIGLSRQTQTFAQTKQNVLDELKHPMPVRIYNLLDSVDADTRRQLRDDLDISTAVQKLPEGVRLTIGRHLWFGRKPPAELMALEGAAEAHDTSKVRQGLAALKQKRESSMDTIEIGNIEEKVNHEFRGTPDAANIRKDSEAALEFNWNEMHALAMQSPRFRALEAHVLRRNPGLVPGKGRATESNVPSNYLSVERNVSLKGAIVRYAHELANFSMEDDFNQVRDNAQAGRYASPHECAMARIDVELQAKCYPGRDCARIETLYTTHGLQAA
jgi:hypothetical protein